MRAHLIGVIKLGEGGRLWGSIVSVPRGKGIALCGAVRRVYLWADSLPLWVYSSLLKKRGRINTAFLRSCRG